jgi:hypothetical protein
MQFKDQIFHSVPVSNVKITPIIFPSLTFVLGTNIKNGYHCVGKGLVLAIAGYV